MKNNEKKLIGFIGIGFVGGNYANDFEERGLDIVRYSLEEPYIKNKDQIKDCDIVFIAVPTPSTPEGFDYSTIEKNLSLVGKGKTVVVKSTILPGTTEKLQERYPDIIVLHSPEFLTEVTASEDAKKPERNIIGYTKREGSKQAAEEVLKVLAKAPYNKIIPVRDAELIKYTCNCFFFTKVVYMNLAYDLAQKLGVDWENIKEAMENTDMISNWHLDPIHKTGRGAGGHCLIKDMAAFGEIYSKLNNEDLTGNMLLQIMQGKNIELLKSTNKDIKILKGVHGDVI